MVKSKKNKKRYQSLDTVVSQEADKRGSLSSDSLTEHKGDMGIHIGDACLRYSTEHSMMIPTSALYNKIQPDFPKCGYSEKCKYRTEKDSEDIRYGKENLGEQPKYFCNYYREKINKGVKW